MFWSQNQTDKEWTAAHLINEQLRHERLAREASVVDWQETTPPGEPTPQISMDRYRQAQLEQQTRQMRDIWQDDKDEELPM